MELPALDGQTGKSEEGRRWCSSKGHGSRLPGPSARHYGGAQAFLGHSQERPSAPALRVASWEASQQPRDLARSRALAGFRNEWESKPRIKGLQTSVSPLGCRSEVPRVRSRGSMVGTSNYGSIMRSYPADRRAIGSVARVVRQPARGFAAARALQLAPQSCVPIVAPRRRRAGRATDWAQALR